MLRGFKGGTEGYLGGTQGVLGSTQTHPHSNSKRTRVCARARTHTHACVRCVCARAHVCVCLRACVGLSAGGPRECVRVRVCECPRASESVRVLARAGAVCARPRGCAAASMRMCVFACVFACVLARIRVRAQVRVRARMRARACPRMRAFVCACECGLAVPSASIFARVLCVSVRVRACVGRLCVRASALSGRCGGRRY